ncbi:MAG: F0F1 ATP synthase subunit gamma [Chloroflexales bacterium]
MASSREIKRRIRSVKNVAQITRAMEMVAASKMRRAQRNVLAARPYADRMRDLIGELTVRAVSGAKKGTLLEKRASVRRVGLIIVTPDRGLCGSLVANVLRRASRFVLDQRALGREVDIFVYGKKGREFASRTGYTLAGQMIKIGDSPRIEDILGVAIDAVKGFESGRYDELYMIYSEFINTLVQRAAIKQLAPVEASETTSKGRADFTYEPSQEEVLREILPRYVESQIYQAILESIASFYSAQMVAMRNATKSAKDLVKDLTLTFNKARQAAITKEVSEIASGAAALAE